MPPRSKPSVSKLMMPRLLWPSAGTSSFGPTLCRLTARGTAMPWSFPNVLIHIHRALWMWPAIIRTVRRGAPGTVASHSSWGRCSTRKTLTRLLVLHAASRVSRWSSAECITTLQRMIKLTPNSLRLSGRAFQRSAPTACWLAQDSRHFLLCMRKSLNATKLQPHFAGRAGRWRNAVPGAKTEVRVFLGEPQCCSLDPQLEFRHSACHEVRRSGDHRVEG